MSWVRYYLVLPDLVHVQHNRASEGLVRPLVGLDILPERVRCFLAGLDVAFVELQAMVLGLGVVGRDRFYLFSSSAVSGLRFAEDFSTMIVMDTSSGGRCMASRSADVSMVVNQVFVGSLSDPT